MATEKKTKGMQEVEAVKDPAMIMRIQDELAYWKGQVYGDIWRVGVNVALRISDLLSLRFEDFEDDTLVVTEQKTGKRRYIPIGKVVRDIVERRRRDNPTHVYLFQSDSNRARGMDEPKPMNRSGVSRAFKEIGELESMKAQFGKVRLGTHSMRKTRGYQLYRAGRSIEEICKLLNHSSPATTMRYIGITRQQVDELYTKYEI